MFSPGQEQTVIVDGRAYPLGKLRVRVLRAWREWIAERIGDPFADVERFIGRVPEAETARQLREAELLRDGLRYFSLGAPVAQRFLNTEEGMTQLVLLLLREKNAKATEDDAGAVVMHWLKEAQAAEAIARAQGTDSRPIAGEGAEGNAAGPAPGDRPPL